MAKSDNKNAIEACYHVNYDIALHGQVHIIGETHCKPRAKDILNLHFEQTDW
jgi:hypothetical protein